MIPGKGKREKGDLTLLMKLKRGGCPVKRGRGAGVALEVKEVLRKNVELGNGGSIRPYIGFGRGIIDRCGKVCQNVFVSEEIAQLRQAW